MCFLILLNDLSFTSWVVQYLTIRVKKKRKLPLKLFVYRFWKPILKIAFIISVGKLSTGIGNRLIATSVKLIFNV